jgi:hypothetical protein
MPDERHAGGTPSLELFEVPGGIARRYVPTHKRADDLPRSAKIAQHNRDAHGVGEEYEHTPKVGIAEVGEHKGHELLNNRTSR